MPPLQPGDALYNHMLREDVFVGIAIDMFRSSGKRANKGAVKLIRKALLKNRNPSLDDIFDDSGYSEFTIASRKSGLRKSTYIDSTDNTLTDQFLNDYAIRADVAVEEVEEIKVSKQDSILRDDICVNNRYMYKDIIDILKNNVNVNFHMPDVFEPVELDYVNPCAQYVQFNHIGSGAPAPFHINYYYKCKVCDHIVRSPGKLTSMKCPMGDCTGLLEQDPAQDVIVHAHVSQVMYGITSLPVVSLTPIPQGEFYSSVIVCRDSKNSSYFIMILAVEEKEYNSTELVFEKDKHVIWQMVDQIDALHQDRLGGHIMGMDYLKAATLLMAVSNACGFKSFNVMVAGRQGVGKTMTGQLYMHTLSTTCKVQDASSLTLPGIMGSSSTIEVNNQKVHIREPGILVRNDLVLLDELYSKKRAILGELKSALASATITKEVSGARFSVAKSACVMATANIDPMVYLKYRERFKEYLEVYFANPAAFGDFNEVTQEAVKRYPIGAKAEELVSETIKIECSQQSVNWIDGQELADLDRFPLIFYVGDPAKVKPAGIPAHLYGSTTVDRPAHEYQTLIYNQELRDYIQFCAKIEVDVESEMPRILEFGDRICLDDHIHSEGRLAKYILYMLKFSAVINQRAYLTDMDYEFVEDMFGHACKWLEPSEMSRDNPLRKREDDADENLPSTGINVGVQLPPATEGAVTSYLDVRFGEYDLFGEGVAMWDRALANIAVDLEEVFTFRDLSDITRYIHDYIEYRGGRPALAGSSPSAEPDRVEVIDTTKGMDEPFARVPYGLSQEEVHGIIVDEFTAHQSITKNALTEFSDKFQLGTDVLNGHINNLRRQGLIMDVGDAFRWTP